MKTFFIIPPIHHLELAKETGCKSVYALAHLCLEEKNPEYKKYKQFFIDCKKEGYHVTLDNSAAEADLVTEDVLIQLTKELMPTEVIAPDFLYDEIKTKIAMRSFFTKMKESGLFPKVKIFGVPQGNDPESFMRSYLFMLGLPYVDVIGLSKLSVPVSFRDITDSNSVSVNRRYLVKTLNELNLIRKPIHLLGMRNITEFKAYEGIKNIRSVDSCYTILSALWNNKLDSEDISDQVNETPHDYFFQGLNDRQLEIGRHNIKELKKCIPFE